MKCVTLDQIYENPHCPIDDSICPYYNSGNGWCMVEVMEGCPAYDECDTFDEDDEFEPGKFIYDEMATNP